MSHSFDQSAGVVGGAEAPTAWTGSGYLNLAAPRPEVIRLDDIARNLSRLARYCGGTSRFYSVAEHSLLCADLASLLAMERGMTYRHQVELERAALMHDAAEFITGDLTRPGKLVVPEFSARLESPVWRAIARRFGLPEALPEAVKLVDNIAAATEKRDLVTDPAPWPRLPPPGPIQLGRVSYPPMDLVAERFLERAQGLGLE